MHLPLKFTLALLALAVSACAFGGVAVAQTPAPAPTPTPRLVVDAPQKRTLIREGQAGRLLMGGAWYFRQDDARRGRFQRARSLRGPSRHARRARDGPP